MKNNKIFLVILFAVAMFVYYAVYMNRPDPEVFVMKPTVEVELRKYARFVEEYAPEGSVIKVDCESANTFIATVAEDGLSVTGKHKGTTTITCSFNEKEFGTTEVTVK